MFEIEQKEDYDIIIIGDAYIDFVFQNFDRYPNLGEEILTQKYELRPGGSAGYTAMALSSLGMKVGIVANIGDDLLSKHWLDFLSKLGINITFVNIMKGVQIGTSVVFLNKTDRSFITYRGANAIDRVNFDPNYLKTKFLLVTGFSQAPYLWKHSFIEFIKKAKEKEITIVLDTNWSCGNWLEIFKKLTPYISYLIVNDDEIKRLTGMDNLYQAQQELIRNGVNICVTKKGKLGCSIIKKDYIKNIFCDIVEPLDLNGAGDFFNAGFIYGLLHGFDEIKACTLGNGCAKNAILNYSLFEKLQSLHYRGKN